MVKREDLWTERVNYATVATDEYKGIEKRFADLAKHQPGRARQKS